MRAQGCNSPALLDLEGAVGKVVGISSRFIGKVDRNTPANLDLHLIIDNYANHKLSGIDTWQLV